MRRLAFQIIILLAMIGCVLWPTVSDYIKTRTEKKRLEETRLISGATIKGVWLSVSENGEPPVLRQLEMTAETLSALASGSTEVNLQLSAGKIIEIEHLDGASEYR